MYRNYISLIAVILSFLFLGCAREPQPRKDNILEDQAILLAYDSFYQKNYDQAYNYFNELYQKNNQSDYFIESLRILILQKKYDEVIKEANNYLASKDDPTVRKLLIESYKNKKEFQNAIETLEKLLKIEKSASSYLLAAEICLIEKDYEKSVEYYKKSYELEPSEYVVDKLAETLYLSLNRIDEAIRYYNSHISFSGCGEFLCQRVGALYAKKGDIDGVISVYRKIYEQDNDSAIGKKIIDLYLLKNDYVGVQEFLESSRLDDVALLKVLKYNQEYKRASEIALKLYKESGEIDYFAQHIMFEFESGDQKNKELIDKTIDGLKSVIKTSNSHIYLNYLGYLMIDNGMDIKEAMEYIKEALRQDSENSAYLDSLAWGYYKQSEYKKAYETIEKVKNSMGQDPIVKEHYETIKNAYEKSIENKE